MDKIERLKKRLVSGYYEEIDIDIKELEKIRIYDKLDELVMGYNNIRRILIDKLGKKMDKREV